MKNKTLLRPIALVLAMVLLFSAVPLITPASAASSQPIPNGTYVIVSALDQNKAVDVSGASTANCANIQLWTRNNTAAQDFKLTYNSNGWYTIVNANSGKALDVKDGTAAKGQNVWQYECNGTAAQQWYLVDAGDGWFYIQSKLGFYLDVDNANTADGTNIKTWTLNRSNAQKFCFIQSSNAVRSRLDAIGNGTLRYNSSTVMKIGFKFTGTRSSEQCKGYAKNVFYMCFGITPGSTQSRDKGLNHLLNSTTGMTKLGSVTNMTNSNISALFSKARPGDFVQMRRSHGGSHSAIVYSVTSSGVTFLEANLDGNNTVYLRTYTWADLCSKNAKMSVYTATYYQLK